MEKARALEKRIIKISEMINPDGTLIHGDKKPNNTDITADGTTDEYMRATRQGVNNYTFRRYFGEDDMQKHPMFDIYKDSKSRKEFEKKAKGKGHKKDEIQAACDKFYPKATLKKEEIEEIARRKMSELVETILDDTDESYDVLEEDPQFPNIDLIYERSPVVAKRLTDLLGTLRKTQISADEKLAILYELINELNFKNTDRTTLALLKKRM